MVANLVANGSNRWQRRANLEARVLGVTKLVRGVETDHGAWRTRCRKFRCLGTLGMAQGVEVPEGRRKAVFLRREATRSGGKRSGKRWQPVATKGKP